MAEMTIIIEKTSSNRLGKAADQVKAIADSLKKRTKVEGVACKVSFKDVPTKFLADGVERLRYEAKLTLSNKSSKNLVRDGQYLDLAKKYLLRSIEANHWKFVGDEADIENKLAAEAERKPFVVPDLTPEDIKREFPGIYQRDSHINIIHLSAKAAALTNFKKRSHTLLYGKPAAAKTVLFAGLKAFYERYNESEDRVLILDSVSASKAGVENFLLDKARSGLLPEFICFEEIEKYETNNLLCLLSMMDGRGTINKMNAKIGNVSQNTPLVVWATCNDHELLRKFQGGSLWSRFSNHIECVRPNREVMEMIMVDKIRKYAEMGFVMSEKCAKIAVDFGFDVLGLDDPRKIESLLDGGDKLLTGEYFDYLKEIERQAKEKREQNLS